MADMFRLIVVFATAYLRRLVQANPILHIRGLLRSRQYLIHRLTFFLSYWKARSVFSQIRFYFRNLWYRTALARESVAQGTRTVLSIFGLITRAALFALFIVLFLTISETIAAVGIDALLSAAKQMGEMHAPFLHNAQNLDDTTLAQLLATIAQVSGAFIGLYFASVTIVASTVYARVPGDIREIVIRDKIGNRYITLIAVLAAVCVLQLAALAAGVKIGAFNLAAVVLLTLAAVLSFLDLGIRLFAFYDPAHLVSSYVAPDLAQLIRSASRRGLNWSDPSFQSHYHRRAERILAIFSDIVAHSGTEPHLQKDSLLKMGRQAAALIAYYVPLKGTIPDQSLWFRRTLHHKNWFEIDESRASIALRTGTQLDPTQVPDYLWFERECARIADACLAVFLERKDYENAYLLISALRNTLSALARELFFEEALEILSLLESSFDAHVKSVPDKQTLEQQQKLIPALAVIDGYGLCLATICVDFAQCLQLITQDEVRLLSNKLPAARTGAGPRLVHFRAVREQIEYLEPRLKFEVGVEGHQVSPDWYVSQLLAIGVRRGLKDGVTRLVEAFSGPFLARVKPLIEAKRYVLGAQLIQRGFEIEKKMDLCLERARELEEKMKTLHRTPDLPVPEIDWEHLRSRADAARETLLIDFGRIVPFVADASKRGELPDYFGASYWYLAEGTHDALLEGKWDLFQKLFALFFLAATAVLDRHRSDWLQPSNRAGMAYYADIIVDLLDMSGTARIIAELGDDTSWRTVCRVWDAYLASSSDPAALLRSIVAATKIRDSLFGISPRGVAQTAWEQKLERLLQTRGIPADRFGVRYGFGDEDEAQAQMAPLLRAMSRMGWFLRPHDVFLATFVRQKDQMEAEDLGLRVREFERALKREEPDAE